MIILLDIMDAFGDNFVNEEVDPVAEFVAREQDQLAGLENEIPSVSMSAPAIAPNTDGNYNYIIKNNHIFFNIYIII